MARAKKEAALTPEERLQAALVPDWEWPYKLPENWCWTRIGNYVDYVTDYVANGSFASLKANVSIFKDENYALMVKTQDFANGFTKSLTYTDKHGYDFLSKSTLHGGELILSNIGSVGKVFRVPYFDRPMTLASNSVMVKCYNSCDYDWMYYFLLSPIGFEELKSITTGTAVPKFNKTDLKTIPLPVPPLAEQQRIVDRIESLFAKLDEAKEKTQTVVDSFETRKSAILHKAFTGELTAKWREEHGVSIDNWKTTRFDSVAAIRSNLVDPAEYQSFPHIAPDNIEKKTGVLLEYHTIAEDGVTSGKHRFYSGQILYSKIRPYLSKAVVVDFGGLCSADMYPIEAYQNARCLWYYMLSDEFLLQASTAGSRSVLPKINQKELSALTVHLPTNDREQEEIARILDELFDKEQQTKEAAEVVLDQIDLMKKSILARAFRGELGTNDPSEESAVELLKKVLHTSAEPKSKTKRKFIPPKIEAQIKTDLERKIIMAFIQSDTAIMPIQQLMSVSSRKFDVIETLRNLQERGILLKENDTYRLMG